MFQTSHLCNQWLTRHNRCRRLWQTATASPSRQRWKQIPSCLDIRLSKRKESRRGVNRLRASNRTPATKNQAILRRSIRPDCRRESRKVLLKPVPSPAPDVLTGTEEEPLALPSLGLLEFELSPGGVFNILTDSRVSLPELFPARACQTSRLALQGTSSATT